MMKRFFTAMLGTVAGIWLSAFLFVALFFVFIIAVASSTSSSAKLTENTVLYLDLNGTIEERKPQLDLMAQITNNATNVLPLNDILQALKYAATDDRIIGLYINCDGATAGMASSEEILNSISEFKKSGKWVYAYADSYTQGNYYIASTADKMFLNPQGNVDIKGLSATTIFFKGLLDKLGVEMQVVKVGTYKSAVEPFILTEMSEASRRQQEHFLGNIWNYISSHIANNRNVDIATINAWADSITITQTPKYYIENNIVDSLLYRHECEEMIADICGVEKFDDVNLITATQYCEKENTLDPDNSTNTIAVLYAVGDIVDQGTTGIVGRTMAPQILELADDDDIDALVLRVNSGGGSAFASEQIWEALEQFKAKGKKFYVSMGHMAASGGYYISCGADKIYADNTTLTGSIGIFGLVPCVKGLLQNNLGITQGTVSTNKNSDFIALSQPMTGYQRQSMQRMIDNGYETFVSRCAEGRNMSVDSIKAIAEGRVWDGQTALEIGLVDKLGGINDAITDLASEMGFETYCIKEYPSLEEELMKQIMNSSASIKQNIAQEEFGEYYQYIQSIKALSNLEPLQCRAEKIIIE